MAYHENFWVTIAAASPVIALTYVTSAGRAERFDNDAMDMGIWDDKRAPRLFVLTGLGILFCTVDFLWALICLATRSDLGHVAVPLLVLAAAFVGVFLVTLLEMRARAWLTRTRREVTLFDQLNIIPDDLIEILVVSDDGHPYWPAGEAARVISAIDAAGHTVQRIDRRDFGEDGSFSDMRVRMSPQSHVSPDPRSPGRPRLGSQPIDAANRAALDAVARVSSTNTLVRIDWK